MQRDYKHNKLTHLWMLALPTDGLVGPLQQMLYSYTQATALI